MRKFSSFCPIASNSKIKLEFIDKQMKNYKLLNNPSYYETKKDKKIAVYDLLDKNYQNSNIGVEVLESKEDNYIQENSDLEVQRSQIGYAEERGGLCVTFKNKSDNKDLSITYFDMIPWYFKIYFNSIKIENTKIENGNDLISEFYHQPSIERVSPTIFEILLTVPANSTTTITYNYSKEHLQYADHPPDCSRGFDIGSAVITVNNITRSINKLYPNQKYIRIYTEPLVLISPAPDFSMPYNVITYTCTVVALFFGSMYNIFTRRYLPLVIEQEKKENKNEEQENKNKKSNEDKSNVKVVNETNDNVNEPLLKEKDKNE